MVFFTGGSWHIIDTGRMCQHLGLIEKRSRSNLRDHHSRLQPRRTGKKRRQSITQIRVHHAFNAALADAHQVRQRNRGIVKSESEGRAVKIPAGYHIAALGEDKRIVRRAGAFDREHLFHMCEGIANSTMHLRYTTNTISILNSWVILTVRFANVTATQQLAHMISDRELARMRSGTLKTGIKGTRRAHQSFQRHRTRHVSDMSEAFRAQ